MLFLYPFDLYGIIYTSVIGGLSLLALIVLLRLAVAKKPSTAGTVAFRIFSFIWMLVLVVLWCAYVLMKIEVLGVSFAGVTEGLVLQYNGTALFVIPFIGFLPGIFNTILGTILLGLVTLLSFINLILSFACRKKKAVAKTPAPEVVAEEQPEPAPEVVAEETPEPVLEVVAEEQPEPDPEVVAEETPEPAPEAVAEEQPEPAPEVVAEETPEPAPEAVAEEQPEPAPEVVA
ncbi:MAG: hypothetical protein IKM44_04855, partial [Clostridia bacterium]|nr:hypothetical protein [Clostridia bacterium]